MRSLLNNPTPRFKYTDVFEKKNWKKNSCIVRLMRTLSAGDKKGTEVEQQKDLRQAGGEVKKTAGSTGSATVSRAGSAGSSPAQLLQLSNHSTPRLHLIDSRSQNEIYDIETKDRNSANNFGPTDTRWSLFPGLTLPEVQNISGTKIVLMY